MRLAPKQEQKPFIIPSTESLTVPRNYGLFIVDVVSTMKELVIIDISDLKWADQCTATAQMAKGDLFRERSALYCCKSEMFIPLYEVASRPRLEHCVQAWSPFFKMDTTCFAQVQPLAARMAEVIWEVIRSTTLGPGYFRFGQGAPKELDGDH